MRTLLTLTLLVPALAAAQAPQQAPAPPRPGFPTPVRRPVVPGGPPAAGTAPATSAPPIPTAAPAPAAGAAPAQEATTSRGAGKCQPLQGRFMLTFNKAELIDVLEQASRWTCRNFIYTDEIARGKISLISKTPVNADEAYAAFLATLSANNIAIYPTGRYYKLVRAADAKKVPIPTYVGEGSRAPALEQPVTKLVRLASTDADQMKGILSGFLSPQGADIQSIPPDVLIVTDIGLNIRRLEKMIEAIDRPGLSDQVHFVQLRWAPAKEIADKLNQIFQQSAPAAGARGRKAGITAAPAAAGAAPGAIPGGEGGMVSVSKIMPEERSNKLIVIADERSFARIQDLVAQLDVPTAGEGGIHVVFLKNANAEDIASTLSALSQGKSSARPPAGAAPAPAAGQAPAAAAKAGAATAEILSGEVKVTADKSQNALVIQAGGSDFVALSRIIEKLDRPRRQVFVEAVIMEVNLNDEKTFGVGAHYLAPTSINGEKSVIPLVSQPGRVSSMGLNTEAGLSSLVGLGGFLTGLAGPVSAPFKELTGMEFPSIGVVIQALQSNSDVNVLSTPHLLAADNEESEISVGQNVPFQSGYAPASLTSLLGSTTTTTALSSLSSYIAPIQRQNVELKLKIKPQINEGDNVKLTIEEQTEEIASTDATLGPTTAKRSVKTQIVARDQSTIVIGGLIQERSVNSVKKIPILGSLPLVGWLFRDSTTTKQKTNLLLFLTPYIIRDESDYRRIFERKRKEQQEFIEAFYGKSSKYDVAVEWDRKSGPFARIHRAVGEEALKLENGGPGLPGEGMTGPRGAAPAAPADAPIVVPGGKDYYDAADEPVPPIGDEEQGDKAPEPAPATAPAPGAAPDAPAEER